MKNLFHYIGALTVGATLTVSCQKAPAPEPIYPIPTQAQIDWQKMETYAFIHFGLNTFNDMEWGFGDTPESTFNPTDMNVNQWASTLKNAGMKGIIITVKHHDGFCLWPTKHGNYSVKNAPLNDGNSDLVKDLIEACKKENLKIGIYISPWDRNHAEYGREGYVEYFHSQVKEMIEEYCAANGVELFEFWFDGANGGDGYYGGAREVRKINPKTYYDYKRAKETIHNKFPNAMIFGGTVPTIRWIGNESGWAGQTNWAMWNADKRDDDKNEFGLIDGKDWLPGEVDVSVRPGWFYHKREDHHLRSLGQLIEYYYQSVGRNANLLLNFPIDLSGKIPASDSARIMKWRETLDRQFANNLAHEATVVASSDRGRGYKAENVNDKSWDSYWATPDSINTGELTLKFKTPTSLNTLLLQEYIALGQRIKKFSVEYQNANKEFVPVESNDTMSTIGYKRIIRFENIETTELKISFKDSRGVPCINNIEAYLAPAVLDQPSIVRYVDGKTKIRSAKGTHIFYTTDNSEPTTASTRYVGEFDFAQKGTIKAIAYDPTTKEYSSVRSITLDIPTANFSIVKPKVDKDNRAAFDGNSTSSYYLPKGENALTFSLGDKHTICGLEYTPDQSRWGEGAIHRYKILVDGKTVKEGEFSNIKHNPIKQTVEFPATVGSTVTIKALSTADGSKRASFAEVSIITQ